MPQLPIEIVEDPRFRAHRGPEGHPERPERLIALDEAVAPYRDRLQSLAPRAASPEELLRVHTRGMVELLEDTRSQPPGRLDADTYFSPASCDVARLAAGSTAELATRVLEGQASRGFAAVRPPGHHAECARSMGFCLFNNVAVDVRALQARGGSPRIFVFDWDVHHGNGTQHLFESDPEVLYASTHQFPFYPGTGDFGEEGEGRGLGTTLNIPMPAGCGDVEYAGIVERIIVPAALGFAPDILIVSCGFDAHHDDPLASMELGRPGFAYMARRLRALAEMLCDGRIVYVLEGGYALTGVREGTAAVLESLVDGDSDSETALDLAPTQLEPGSLLKGLVDRVVEVHGRRIPNLGAR